MKPKYIIVVKLKKRTRGKNNLKYEKRFKLKFKMILVLCNILFLNTK